MRIQEGSLIECEKNNTESNGDEIILLDSTQDLIETRRGRWKCNAGSVVFLENRRLCGMVDCSSWISRFRMVSWAFVVVVERMR